jgi:hypothetical protein
MDITQDGFDEENVKDTFEYPQNAEDITGYEHLHFMCKNVRNESHSARGYESPITPRLKYIMEALSTTGISFELSVFNENNSPLPMNENSLKLANVVVFLKGTNKELPTIVFTAHHDIANPNSENCQDNTASVCNLIHLAKILKKKEEEGTLNQSVVIAFTDCEEVGGRGINDLNNKIIDGKYGNLYAIYALELTACGGEIWASGTTSDNGMVNNIVRAFKKDVHIVKTPYNESVNSRRDGLAACCIGILPTNEIQDVLRSGYCSTWALCHRMEDTFEKSANKEDMNNFVNSLVNMVNISK